MAEKAGFYFKNRRVDLQLNKKYHTCTKCNKDLVDSGNSTGKLSHIKSCHPETLNKLKNTSVLHTISKIL